MKNSSAASIASLSKPQRAKLIKRLSPKEAEELLYCWRFWAREKQLPPTNNWLTWLILAGRGFGKTRTGAEAVRDVVEADGARSELRIALVGRTAADVRDTMILGESGLMACSPPWNRPKYVPSKRLVQWRNGAQALCFSAEEPNLLRGPQYHFGWADEIAAWKYPETWDQLQFGLRLIHRSGRDPQVVATTTPRPTPLIRDLIKDPFTATTYGSTYENKANLAKAFIRKILAKYEGTRLGRQELLAEVLADNPGALWVRDQIDALRVRHVVDADEKLVLPMPPLGRIVVSVDPAVTKRDPNESEGGKKGRKRKSNETGIIVLGESIPKGKRERHGYVLADYSGRYSPNEWGQKVVWAVRKWGADAVVAEVNQGGDLVESNITNIDPNVSVIQVRATRGKHVRAEPIAALYEQERMHHVGSFPELEDQMCTWDPDDDTVESPDRMDALVWGATELIGGGMPDVDYDDQYDRDLPSMRV